MRDFLRHVNLVFAVVGIWLCFVIGMYVWNRYRADELSYLRSQLAVALLVYFLFETARIGRVWFYLLPGSDTGVDAVLVIAATGAAVGMVCLSRVLSPITWGIWRWIIPATMLAVSAAVSQVWLK